LDITSASCLNAHLNYGTFKHYSPRMSRNFQHAKVLSHIHVQLELGYCKSVPVFVSTASLLEISFHPQTANLSCRHHKTRNSFSYANTAQLFVNHAPKKDSKETGQIRPQAMLSPLHFVLVEFSSHQATNKQAIARHLCKPSKLLSSLSQTFSHVANDQEVGR
jgi:hypothetical protein